MRWLRLVLLALLVGGCATAFPESVMRTVDTRITADELARQPAALKGARVILGGEILAVQPRPGLTEVELLMRRLRGDDSPERSDRSPGRALLHTPEFLDPAVYAPGPAHHGGGRGHRRGGAQDRRSPLPVPGDHGGADPPLAEGRGGGPRLLPISVGIRPVRPYYDPFYIGPRRYHPGWWW